MNSWFGYGRSDGKSSDTIRNKPKAAERSQPNESMLHPDSNLAEFCDAAMMRG